ncbi:bile acid:sodium symporter family protein [Alphaproteobacteria bacterium]|nr:bile acid:sodium symporter family protein [Alphaproteobacteria bacterium]
MGLISSVFLPLAIAFIMFSLGLNLRISDFTRIFTQPKDLIIGLFSQIIILPIVAFILIIFYPNLPVELAVGVMILAAVPGGATSNFFTSLAKGDVALSISLTALTSLICIITIPFIAVYSYNYFVGTKIDVSILQKSLELFAIVTVPTILGMLVNSFFNSFALNFESKAKVISIVLLALVIIGAIIKYQSDVMSYFKQAGLITLILNILMMIIAFYIGKFFASSIKKAKTFVFELGLQNGSVAIFVADSIFGGGPFIIPAATYSLIMFLTSIIFVYLIKDK